MAKILIVYYSETLHTAQMARHVEQGVRYEVAGSGAPKLKAVEVECKKVEDTKVEELLDADGIVLGSPTYFGTMAAEMKRFLDESIKYHAELAGKVGGAFTSCSHVGSGGETAVLCMLKALLIHGMIIQGDVAFGHYGPVAIRAPGGQAEAECMRLGRRIVRLVSRLAE